MANLQLKSLVAKLNSTSRQCLEGAAGLCLSRTHYHVEIEHWLLKLIEQEDGDLPVLLRHFDVDTARFQRVLEGILDKMRTGNGRPPSLSTQTVELIKAAWMLATVQYGDSQIRSGHILAALIRDPLHFDCGAPLVRLLDGISADAITDGLPSVAGRSVEARRALPVGALPGNAEAVSEDGSGTGSNPNSKTPNLDRYTNDLTAQARQGKIDPVLGRDAEIRQLMDILLRRRQNNPILTGEPGVGKTAVVEGFALKVVRGDVPDALKGISIRSLDLGQLEAGAGVKGEFENRLKSILNEIGASPTPIILMIDEAHTLIGAGGDAGGGDAANLLKPALARGELRTIAATTWSEYKKYFEKDAALTRRFQVVKVEEPSQEVAKAMLRGNRQPAGTTPSCPYFGRSHRCGGQASRAATSRAVNCPTKPSACWTPLAPASLSAKTARLRRSKMLAPVANKQRRMERLQEEQQLGADHEESLLEVNASLTQTNTELEILERRYESEQQMVSKILEIKRAIQADHASPAEQAANADADAAKGVDAVEACSDRPPQSSVAETIGSFNGSGSSTSCRASRTAAGVRRRRYPIGGRHDLAWTGIPLGRDEHRSNHGGAAPERTVGAKRGRPVARFGRNRAAYPFLASGIGRSQ
ncbi:Chaperone protein ClpB [Roseimaritima ulvae]|uniref:Chaperone protein ClpB n=1 Tax=Roseimaritima ulvae TaxID=980254 RepID=A0A5B9QT56_9BACT|nr:Clp protease N-terminal domain-containing protein [Roseimaritima ulvae]QEG40595.1 Chaperone protein ClpB [Roseimaritima ulvae]